MMGGGREERVEGKTPGQGDESAEMRSLRRQV